ncbi:MAG: nucleotidyltransferase domain-containing protein [bacterium]|nr:nucleotidyltransferase domain-containing protein [bacterium]
MLNEKDKEIIIQYAKRYQVGSVYLFGSSLNEEATATDIDLGVTGLVPKYFFKFYGELLRHLSKPVDIVDLSKRTSFTQIIIEKGIKIYG